MRDGDVERGGRWPRDLAVTGDRIFVANERSHELATFEVDGHSEVPRLIGTSSVPSPGRIVWA